MDQASSHPQDIYDLNNNQNLEIKILDVKKVGIRSFTILFIFETNKFFKIKNRSLVAKKSFAKDEILFQEQPLVCSQFAWNKFYNYKVI